ncbi:MAG: hypothetical protein MJ230_07635 [bacterium]|nr:hypothetical protein [bacterium]
MKKKTISILLSTLCIIFIGVSAPFSAYADGEGIADNIIADLITENAKPFTETVADMVKLMSGDYSQDFTMNRFNVIGWQQAYELKPFTNAPNDDIYSSWVMSYEMFNVGKTNSIGAGNEAQLFSGLHTLDSSGYTLQANTINVTYVDDRGLIKRIVIVPNDTILTEWLNGKYTINLLNGGYYYYRDTPDSHYQFGNALWTISPNNDNWNFKIDGYTMSSSGGNQFTSYIYPLTSEYNNIFDDALLRGDYYANKYSFIPSYERRSSSFVLKGVYTNTKEFDNTDMQNYNNYYTYNDFFQYGDTYNKNDTQNIVNNMLNKYAPVVTTVTNPVVTGGGGWDSPDFPNITGSAVLQPSLVEFSTADIPTNLMQVGTSFLTESLKVVDTIPYFMLSISIIFMVWVCFHIFGK